MAAFRSACTAVWHEQAMRDLAVARARIPDAGLDSTRYQVMLIPSPVSASRGLYVCHHPLSRHPASYLKAEQTDQKLTDAAALAGHLIPAGSMFAFLAADRAEVFRDADYADPATQMAAVLTLQALCDYSGRETAEAVQFDVRWKVAVGAALDDAGFDPSTLVYWRNPDREVGAAASGQRRGQDDDRQTGCRVACGAAWWTRRSWLTRWLPRTGPPGWSALSAGWPGRCLARRGRSR